MRAITAWILLPLFLAGCGFLLGPKPDRTRTFVLTSLDAESGAADGTLSVGIGSIRLPAYLDGLGIVTRVGASELRTSSTNRWAEPLDDGFRRALGDNLAVLLGTDRVVSSSWFGKQQPSFSVAVQVERFESGTDGRATLVARWTLRHGAEDTVVAARESRCQRAVAGDSAPAAVAALSACVEDLSRDIAAAIRAAAIREED